MRDSGVHPSKMALDQMGHRIGPIVAGIEAGHKVKVLAAVLLKNLHVLLADFDRGLEAVGDKRRREHQAVF